MRLEIRVLDQVLNGFAVRHDGARHPLVPQPVGVADAVGAVQRTALDVIEAQTALAVLDHRAGPPRQPLDLVGRE